MFQQWNQIVGENSFKFFIFIVCIKSFLLRTHARAWREDQSEEATAPAQGEINNEA